MKVHILCWCGRPEKAAAPGAVASLADYPTAPKDTGKWCYPQGLRGPD